MDKLQDMEHFMWDIETLGTGADSVVTSIGIVKFNIENGKILGKYATEFDVQEQLEAGRTVTASTLAFWMKQPRDAQSQVLDAMGDTGMLLMSMDGALRSLTGWIHDNSTGKKLSIWGNGPSFDNAIMKDLYSMSNIKYPFKYNDDRCMRTMVDMCRTLTDIDPKEEVANVGTVHNALDDAVYQAKVISFALSQIKKAVNPNRTSLYSYDVVDLVRAIKLKPESRYIEVKALEKRSLSEEGPATLISVTK